MSHVRHPEGFGRVVASELAKGGSRPLDRSAIHRLAPVGPTSAPAPNLVGILAAMNRGEFERVVDDVLETLPQWIVDRVDNVHVIVEERPTRQQDPSGHGLLGLYEGVSLLDRGVDYFAAMPDVIYIFRQPHLELGLSRDELRAEIRKTVLHELGHHLGIDDDRMHEIGYD